MSPDKHRQLVATLETIKNRHSPDRIGADRLLREAATHQDICALLELLSSERPS